MNVYGSTSSAKKKNKLDETSFVQKQYLTTNYIESNIEQDFEVKNQFERKKYLLQSILIKLIQSLTLMISSTIRV